MREQTYINEVNNKLMKNNLMNKKLEHQWSSTPYTNSIIQLNLCLVHSVLSELTHLVQENRFDSSLSGEEKETLLMKRIETLAVLLLIKKAHPFDGELTPFMTCFSVGRDTRILSGSVLAGWRIHIKHGHYCERRGASSQSRASLHSLIGLLNNTISQRLLIFFSIWLIQQKKFLFTI